MRPLYFDFAASTPIDPRVAEVMCDAITNPDLQGNPSSNTHVYGWAAQDKVEEAREHVAAIVGAKPREIIFTSGATEANNIVIRGVVEYALSQGKERPHVITSAIEHKAVLETCEQLQEQGLITLTIIKPNTDGIISPEQISAALTPDTLLVSIMHINNELGNVNPIADIGKVCEQAGVLFHVDGAQSVGKIPVDLDDLHVDYLTFSGHKIYGPKGIGVLCSKRTAVRKIKTFLFGGSQERGIKPGTMATHQIMAIGMACKLLKQEMHDNLKHIQMLRDNFLSQLKARNIKHTINSSATQCYPGIVNIRFDGIESDHFLMALPQIAISTGSACNSAEKTGSHVLIGIGKSEAINSADVRISFGSTTSFGDIEKLAEFIKKAIDSLSS